MKKSILLALLLLLYTNQLLSQISDSCYCYGTKGDDTTTYYLLSISYYNENSDDIHSMHFNYFEEDIIDTTEYLTTYKYRDSLLIEQTIVIKEKGLYYDTSFVRIRMQYDTLGNLTQKETYRHLIRQYIGDTLLDTSTTREKYIYKDGNLHLVTTSGHWLDKPIRKIYKYKDEGYYIRSKSWITIRLKTKQINHRIEQRAGIFIRRSYIYHKVDPLGRIILDKGVNRGKMYYSIQSKYDDSGREIWHRWTNGESVIITKYKYECSQD